MAIPSDVQKLLKEMEDAAGVSPSGGNVPDGTYHLELTRESEAVEREGKQSRFGIRFAVLCGEHQKRAVTDFVGWQGKDESATKVVRGIAVGKVKALLAANVAQQGAMPDNILGTYKSLVSAQDTRDAMRALKQATDVLAGTRVYASVKNTDAGGLNLRIIDGASKQAACACTMSAIKI